MKITKRQLRRVIKEYTDDPRGMDMDDETKATMVMEAVQQNLNDPYFVDGLFEFLGLGE